MTNAKYQRIRKASQIGEYQTMFNLNFDRIPLDITNALNADMLGELVDVIHKAYEAGKQAGREHMLRNPEEAKIMLGNESMV